MILSAKNLCNYNPKNGKPKLDPDMAHNGTPGVKIEQAIKNNAKIMLGTATSYLIIQIPAFSVDFKEGFVKKQNRATILGIENPAAWVALAATLVWFFWYLWKMYHAGETPKGSVDDDYCKQTVKRIENGELSLRAAISMMQDRIKLEKKPGMSEPLNSSTNDMFKKILIPFFCHYDENHDQKISWAEFRMLLKDVKADLPEKTAEKKFRDIAGQDQVIDFNEFVTAMVDFATKDYVNTAGVQRVKTANFYLESGEKDAEAGEEDEEEDMPEDLAKLSPEEQQKRLKSRAFQGMFLGTALVLLFSDPMTDMLAVIAKKLNVSAFIVAFVVAPLASNAAELVSSMKIAAKKTPAAMTGALSTLVGAAIMNNTFCLSIFMVLIVWKDLEWQFAAETMSILIIQVLIAGIVLKFETQTMVHGAIIMACYPVALIVVLSLQAVGWD